MKKTKRNSADVADVAAAVGSRKSLLTTESIVVNFNTFFIAFIYKNSELTIVALVLSDSCRRNRRS